MEIRHFQDGMEVYFYEQPWIGHRDDAIALLDVLLEADGIQGYNYALEALRDAIERYII